MVVHGVDARFSGGHSHIRTITAFISPSRTGRDRARALFPAGRFIEIYVGCRLGGALIVPT